MDPKQIAFMDGIIRQQLERLEGLREKLKGHESMSLSDSIQILSEISQIEGILTAMMAISPRSLVERYAPHMGSVKDIANYSFTITMGTAEELEEELESAYDIIQEGMEEEKGKAQEELEVKDIFGRKVKSGVAGLRRRRR